MTPSTIDPSDDALVERMVIAASNEAARIDPGRGIAWGQLDESRRGFARKIMKAALRELVRESSE